MTNDLARRETGITPADVWGLMRDQAATIVKSGFLPPAINTPEKALALMLKGRELGVPPMAALTSISIVQGRPVCSAELMLALIRRDYGPGSIRVASSTNEACRVEWRSPGWDGVQHYEWTIADARTAGLAGQKGSWTQYPAAMLRARCVSAVARMAFPECIAGMYSADELGANVVIDGAGAVVLDESPAPAAPAQPAPRPTPNGTTPAPAAPSTAPLTGQQEDALDADAERLDERQRFIADFQAAETQAEVRSVRDLLIEITHMFDPADMAILNQAMRAAANRVTLGAALRDAPQPAPEPVVTAGPEGRSYEDLFPGSTAAREPDAVGVPF